MFSCEIRKIISSDGVEKIKVRKSYNEKLLDEFLINIGDELVVKPQNKLKLKHRDRRVKILKFNENIKVGLRARVKFMDNGRCGFVDIEDLENLV